MRVCCCRGPTQAPHSRAVAAVAVARSRRSPHTLQEEHGIILVWSARCPGQKTGPQPTLLHCCKATEPVTTRHRKHTRTHIPCILQVGRPFAHAQATHTEKRQTPSPRERCRTPSASTRLCPGAHCSGATHGPPRPPSLPLWAAATTSPSRHGAQSCVRSALTRCPSRRWWQVVLRSVSGAPMRRHRRVLAT